AESTEEPVEEAAAEAEATEAPAEEAAAEATEEPAEEAAAEATAEPAEEGAAEAPMDDAVAMGGYLVTLSGGCGCHMNRDLGALAGGNEFETPAGVVYAANITPDEATGIGSWTAEDIALALQTGAEPDGEQLHPVMPYMRFSALSDQEALAIGDYLLSLDPVANEVPEGELSEEPAAYTPANEPPAEAPTDPVARGEQLVTVTNCGGCHTPKNEDGSAMADMLLAGAPLREEFAHNITPDEATGIGSWSEEEIATFLQTGTFPDGSQVEGAMAQQIERRFSTLTDADAAAIAAYLKSIPAVENAAPSE
ncbi:MAG TPA: c-type cytochrome, partial [Caldilineaceae bacterium]|nr:c-type cytochrome [Caldilineaceae bacterium]